MGEYNILENIKEPRDLDKLDQKQVESLCGEIREKLISTVSKKGGHLASNLGVVELTVALHRNFNFPADKLIFDVGHQCYTHKLLTGRYDRFDTLREKDGLTGFMSPKESEYDSFLTGHSSTSISAGCGFAAAKTIKGEDGYVVCVIGDGALSGGLAYEGLNNAGKRGGNFIVILNDNKMSISKNVGGMARHLTVVRTSPTYHKFKRGTGRILQRIPLIGTKAYRGAERVKNAFKRLIYRKTIFEDMGFTYLGPIDGHDLEKLDLILDAAKHQRRPTLVHISTVKGKGYEFAEESPSAYHGVSAFDIDTGERKTSGTDYSKSFGNSLCKMAAADSRICAVTAAMGESTGLGAFSHAYPKRYFDVGIAEQHAVTFCSALAASELIPVFAVYSSFLQRAYDQLVHDAAAQSLKLVLGIDRAGIVGEDGITHQGVFDVAFLNTIPNVTIYAPVTFNELDTYLYKATYEAPSVAAVRYPRGGECELPSFYQNATGSFAVYGNGENAIVTYGRTASQAFKAAAHLKNIRVVVLYQIKPIDLNSVKSVLDCKNIYFFEEGMRVGGVGEHFEVLCRENGYNGEFSLTAIEDEFIPQQTVAQALNEYGLDAEGIYRKVVGNNGTKA